MGCKPESHYIGLGTHYRIEVVVDEGSLGQRYIPQHLEAGGVWKSLLPEGKVRLTVREARNDCAMHSGLKCI